MIKRFMWVVAGLICTVIAMALLLRVVPVNSGWKSVGPTIPAPLVRYVRHAEYTCSRGWNLQNVITEQFNNNGFVCNFDYSSINPTAAIKGDSYMQAAMISNRHRFHELIDESLNRKAQSIGIDQSGAGLTDYLVTARWARSLIFLALRAA